MTLDQGKLIVKRPYKEVYKCDDSIVKVFEKDHPKSAVFNEALNTVRIEEAGLDIPKLKEVTQIDGKWSIVIEYKEGKTLEEMMQVDHANAEKYMSDFVDLQLKIHGKKAPMLNKLKDKLARQIDGLKELDATQRYELRTRFREYAEAHKGMPR